MIQYKIKLEGIHRVRTHAVLLLTLTLTLTFDLSTQNHVTCRISQVYSLYQVWTLWDYSFLSYGTDISVNSNCNPNPNHNLDLCSFNPKPYHLQDITRSFPISSLNSLRSFVFELCCTLVWKTHLLTLWPWPLSLNPKTVPLVGYSKVIPYTKFEHFGIIRFWVMPRTNKQTDR